MQRWAKLVLAVAIIGISVGSAYATSRYLTSESSCQAGAPVLASFYPVYDFARHVVADTTEVSLLVPMTVDVHDFTPDACSIRQVASAKVLIYSGAGLEPWISQIVSAANNPNLILIDSSKGITTINVPPEFQADGRVIDPHIWLDPVLAKEQVNNILQGLIKAYPSQNDTFTTNGDGSDPYATTSALKALPQKRRCAITMADKSGRAAPPARLKRSRAAADAYLDGFYVDVGGVVWTAARSL